MRIIPFLQPREKKQQATWFGIVKKKSADRRPGNHHAKASAMDPHIRKKKRFTKMDKENVI